MDERRQRERERDLNRLPCEEQALRLLAGRAHFRAELEQKLARRGYAEGEIAAALARLAAAGHLDDLALAKEEGGRLAARKGLARKGVAAELRRKGAPPEAVEGALEPLADEPARAAEAARRWLRSHALDAAALGRHLARKGYGQGVIFRILNELAPDAERPSDD